jgi:PST family polysaccharide transporter
MALRTALFWSGIQTIVRLALSFASIKVTSVYLGASGLAMVGQLNNFIDLLKGGVGNAIQTGVTKLTAESEDDKGRQACIWRTGLQMAVVSSFVVAVVVASAAFPLSQWLFDTPDYWPVFVLAGPCLVLAIMGVIYAGILNGLKRIRDLAQITIFTTIFGSALFIPLAYRFGVWGGLIGTILSTASMFFVAWVFLRRAQVVGRLNLRGYWDVSMTREISRFYPMLLAHSAVSPFALILVRNILSDGLNMDAVGYWQAAWRISDLYTQVLTTALSLYLMSHLASIKTDDSFASELVGATYKVALLTATAAAGIYVLRDVVIAVVFTREFIPVKDLFAWQLTGDVLKMAGWPMRMALVIKLRTRWYIAIEAAAPLIHAGLTAVLLPSMQGNAATLGYALSYLLVDFLVLVALRDYILRKQGPMNDR